MEPYNFADFSGAQEWLTKGTLDATISLGDDLQMRWKQGVSCDLKFFKLSLLNLWHLLYQRRPLGENPIQNYKENGVLDTIKRRYFASKCLENFENKS